MIHNVRVILQFFIDSCISSKKKSFKPSFEKNPSYLGIIVLSIEKREHPLPLSLLPTYE